MLELLRRDLLDLAVGEDASRIEALWERLFRATHATTVGAITGLALAASISRAWDGRCRALGQPLWRLAGGRSGVVAALRHGRRLAEPATEELVPRAESRWRRGFRGIKVKIGKPDAQ